MIGLYYLTTYCQSDDSFIIRLSYVNMGISLKTFLLLSFNDENFKNWPINKWEFNGFPSNNLYLQFISSLPGLMNP